MRTGSVQAPCSATSRSMWVLRTHMFQSVSTPSCVGGRGGAGAQAQGKEKAQGKGKGRCTGGCWCAGAGCRRCALLPNCQCGFHRVSTPHRFHRVNTPSCWPGWDSGMGLKGGDHIVRQGSTRGGRNGGRWTGGYRCAGAGCMRCALLPDRQCGCCGHIYSFKSEGRGVGAVVHVEHAYVA